MRDGKLRGSKYKHNQIKVNITHEHGAKSKFYIQNMSISPTLHMPSKEKPPLFIQKHKKLPSLMRIH